MNNISVNHSFLLVLCKTFLAILKCHSTGTDDAGTQQVLKSIALANYQKAQISGLKHTQLD